MKKLSRRVQNTARRFRGLFGGASRVAPRRRLYTSELLEAREMLAADILSGANLLHNASNPNDVNADGRVTALDALMVIQQLIQASQAPAPSAEPESFSMMAFSAMSVEEEEPSLFYDVNNDNRLTALDALMIVNQLVAQADETDLLQFDVRVTDLSGNAITQVTVGQEFLLEVSIKDLRDAGNGVFSAYLDVGFENNKVFGVTNSLTHYAPYGTASQGSISNATGLINDAGSFTSNTTNNPPLGTTEYKFITARFQATNAGANGSTTFTTLDHGNGALDSALFPGAGESPFAIAAADIAFGSVTLAILGALDDGFNVGEKAGAATVNVLANDTLGGTLQVTNVNSTGTLGLVTLEGGLVKYNPNGQFNSLAAGQTATDTFTYTISNGTTTDTATVTITITGAGESPVVTAATFNGVLEHAPTGTVVGTVVATDTDSTNAQVGFAITAGNTNNAFAIDNDGVIKVANPLALDFEAKSQYVLTVEATDELGNKGSAQITINLQDLKLVEVFIEAYDANGNLIPEGGFVAQGATVELRVYFQDIRPNPAGMLIASADINYSTILTLNDAPTFGSDFPDLRSSTTNVAGIINEATASNLANSQDLGKSLFLTATFTASSLGVVNFTSDAADQQPVGIGVGILDAPALTNIIDVIYGSTSFEIVATLDLTAADDAVSATEGTNLNVNAANGVLKNDRLGVDGGALAVVNTGTHTTTNGATLILNADGSYSYNIAGVAAFEQLPAGQTLVETFVYTIADGLGNTDEATITFTTTGVNDAPTATSIPAQQATEDSIFILNVASNFSDVDLGDSRTYTAKLQGGAALPAWLTLNPTTGVFSGTPANADVGALVIEVTAKDSQNATVSTTFNLTIQNTNDAPTVTSIADQQANEDSAFNLNVAGNFADVDAGDTLTYSAELQGGGALPAWLSFSNGVFSGTPANGDVGGLAIVVTAADGQNAAISDTFQLTVVNTNDAPTATPIANQQVDEDSPFALDVAGNFADVDAGDALTYTAKLQGGAALPAWLSFTGSAFGGTPSNGDVGALTIVVTAKDSQNAGVDAAFTLTVLNTNDAPVLNDRSFNIRPDSNTGTVVGTLVAADVDAGDSLTYEITAGNEAGIFAINSATGQITVALDNQLPDGAGPFVLTVRVVDSASPAGEDTAAITINVVPNSVPTVENPIADQPATEDAAFNFTFPANTFADEDAGDTLTYSAQVLGGAPLPTWLSFNAATRTFSGTPGNEHVGVLQVEVIATDTFGDSVSDVFSITVANVNDAPTAPTPIGAQNATEDVLFTLAVSGNFNDIDAGDGLTYSLRMANGDPLPSWISINAATGVISGTPLNADVGSLNLIVRATDGGAASVDSSFTLNVANVNDNPTSSTIPNQQVNEDAAFNFNISPFFSDVDPGDDLEFTATLVGGGALPSWLSLNAATGVLSGTPLNAHVGTITVRVTAEDLAGATTQQDFTITVVNTNDAPTVVSEIPNQSTNEDAAFALDVSTHFADVDAGDARTYTAALVGGGALPAWLSFNTTTGVFSGTPLNADVGTIVIVVTAKDAANATVSDTFQLTVVNTNDAPTTTAGAITTSKGAVKTGNLLGFVTDVDADDTLTITTPGTITTARGATVTINANGSYTYDPTTSAELQALTFGQSLADSFTYTVRDAANATAQGTVNVTVNGLNPSSVSGKVFIDSNGDKKYTAGEMTFSDVKIELTRAGGFKQTAYTDANGNYKFSNLEPGTYTITEFDPAGVVSLDVSIGTAGGTKVNANAMTFTIGANQSIDAVNHHFRESGLTSAGFNMLFVFSDAPTAGFFVSANQQTGAPIYKVKIGGWANYTNVVPTLSSDLKRVDIVAFDASGNEYRGSISTSDTLKFRWIDYAGSPRQYAIIADSSQVVLTKVTAPAPAASLMMFSAPPADSSSTSESSNSTSTTTNSSTTSTNTSSSTSTESTTSSTGSADDLWGLTVDEDQEEDDYLAALDLVFSDEA